MVTNIFTKVCYIFLVTSPVTYSRVYNIDDDAITLYGEHFDEVLRRFRRTPDYLTILQERYDTMTRYFIEITVQVMQSIETRITKRVAEMVQGSKPSQPATTTHPPHEGQQSFFRAKKLRRQGEDEDKPDLPDPVVSLDSYYLLHRVTSTKERNDFRQLGFDMAREMVQLIIKGMGPITENSDQPSNSYVIPVKSPTTVKSLNGNNNLNGAHPGGNGNGNGHGSENLIVTGPPDSPHKH